MYNLFTPIEEALSISGLARPISFALLKNQRMPGSWTFPEKISKKKSAKNMGLVAAIGILLPFPFYYWLWTQPQTWVNLCGKGKDPSKIMAYVSHFLKLLQFIYLYSVSSLSWPPPFYFYPLFGFGQFLNFRSILYVCVYIYIFCFNEKWDLWTYVKSLLCFTCILCSYLKRSRYCLSLQVEGYYNSTMCMRIKKIIIKTSAFGSAFSIAECTFQ